MVIIHYCLLILVAILALPVAVFCLQIVSSLFYRAKAQHDDRDVPLKVAVLMPAHNEALVIAPPIQSIMSQLTSQDMLLVIADNCDDDTASIAKSLGATVKERFHDTERGKGYALDFGLRQLESTQPDVVIIIDADCIVQAHAINRLVNACHAKQRPMQALYLMESQPNPNLKAKIASFAWLVKNKVRPLGFNVLGLPCQLMGTGMAFLWQDIKQVDLASGHIVEDMKLGTDLAAINKAPLFLHEALVTSVFPPSDAATNTQRARWEHGHLSVILHEAPKLIWGAIRQANSQMLGLACDLLIPPLAMLTMLCLAVTGLTLLLGHSLIITFSLLLIAGLAVAVLLAWFVYGREVVSFKQLCYTPIYVLIKIPLYIKFFLKRQVEWVRSKRD